MTPAHSTRQNVGIVVQDNYPLDRDVRTRKMAKSLTGSGATVSVFARNSLDDPDLGAIRDEHPPRSEDIGYAQVYRFSWLLSTWLFPLVTAKLPVNPFWMLWLALRFRGADLDAVVACDVRAALPTLSPVSFERSTADASSPPTPTARRWPTPSPRCETPKCATGGRRTGATPSRSRTTGRPTPSRFGRRCVTDSVLRANETRARSGRTETHPLRRPSAVDSKALGPSSNPMASQRRMRVVRMQTAWMLAVVGLLVVTESLSLDLFFLFSVVGFLLVTELTTSFSLTPDWRRRLRWVLAVAVVVSAYLVASRILAILPGGML
jgi:hypothetical protein